MNLKKIGILAFLLFCLFPIYKTYAQTTNTGFVQTNIWYNKNMIKCFDYRAYVFCI